MDMILSRSIKARAGHEPFAHPRLRGVYPMAASLLYRYTLNVKYRSPDQVLLLSQLKGFIAEMFRPDILLPDSIEDDAPLIGGTYDLDSFDMLELAICIEEEFGIAIHGEEESRIAFGSIASLARFIHLQTQSGQAQLIAARRSFSGTADIIPPGSFARSSIA